MTEAVAAAPVVAETTTLEVVPGDAVDPQLPQPVEIKGPKIKRKASRFHELHLSLKTPKDIGEYIETNHKTLSGDGKLTNLFVQAVCGRDAATYQTLFSEFKPHMLFLLERVLQQADANKSADLSVFVCELILRAEAGGMKKASWSDGVQPLPGLESLPLQTAKEMLHTLSERSAKIKCLRRIELTVGMAELESCALHMVKDEFQTLTAAEQTAVIARFLSKFRRVLFVPKEKKTKRPRDDTSAETAEKKEGDEEATPAAAEDDAVEAGSAPHPGFEDCLVATLDLVDTTFLQKKTTPPNKLKNFTDWVKDIVPETHAAIYEQLVERTSTAAESEADHLEAVMELKTCDSDEGFDELFGKLCPEDDEGKRAIKLLGPDVLSALAVAAGKRSDECKEKTMHVLADAQRVLGASQNAGLPRRATTFLVEERAKHRRKNQGPAPTSAPVPAPAKEEDDAEEASPESSNHSQAL